MEAAYKKFKKSLEKREISEAQFNESVNELRFQAADGSWLQINPVDGTWMKWDGKQWSRQDSPQQKQQIPEKFFPLLGYILKTTLRNFKKQLPMMVVFAIIGWLFHTYLLVFINEGFGESSFVGRFLATQGNSVSGTVIWMVGSGLLFSWFNRIILKRGPKGPKPRSIVSYFKEAGAIALASLASAAGISLIIGIATNTWASVALAVGFGGLILSQGGKVVALLLRSAWSSTYGLAQGKQIAEFGIAAGHVALLGCAAGFILSSIFDITLVKVIMGGILLVLAFFLARRQNTSIATTALMILPPVLFVIALAYLIDATPVFADDGGWVEAGGTFSTWIVSEGAAQAVVRGAGPAVGVALGPSLAQALTGIGSGLGDDGLDGGVTTEDEPAPEPPIITDEQGEPLERWSPEYGPGDDGYAGQPGDVWLWGRWVSPDQARAEVAEQVAINQQWEAESRARAEQFQEQEWNKLVQRNREEAAAWQAEQARRQSQVDQAAIIERNRARMLDRLRQDESLRGTVDELVEQGNYDKLEEIYRGKLQDQINEGQREADYYNAKATALQIGETAARMTVTASKGALMAIGGPAGIAVTAATVGAISAAEEGAVSYVRGDPMGEVIARSSLGFLSGAKDGAISVFTNVGNVGKFTKVFMPATGDVAETYIRSRIDNPNNESHSDSIKKALSMGALSVVSDTVGARIDGIQSGVIREATKLTMGGISGGTASVINGGTFAEGFEKGVEGGVAGRIGGALGSKAATYARTGTERSVQNAIDDIGRQKQQVIEIDDQAPIIKDLDGTRRTEIAPPDVEHVAVRRPDGTVEIETRLRTPDTDADPDVTGTKQYVDEQKALEQLRDTRSSRTGKQAPEDTRDAIVATRQDKIYAPADETTISKVGPRLIEEGIMQPGDKLTMDTFSTPGKKPSLGADRDARLVIERVDPDTGNVMKIEVDRQHWENDAYQDFYEHTTRIAGGEDAITPDTHPDYTRRLDELRTELSGQGYTDDQIKHRAWAEAHNQLFTDKFHMEASMDNSDQLTRFVGGEAVDAQGTPSVMSSQRGDGTLMDPEGYARMWEEKSRIYSDMGNQPEAVAQSQKGIEQYMKLRDGYHAQGYDVPPVDDTTARAMELITRAPVGVDANDAAMQQLNQDLQGLGFRDTNDALGKIATQSELLKWSKPPGDFSSSQTMRLSRDAVQSPMDESTGPENE